MYGTKLQKWEQITTTREMAQKQMELWCMVQSYKNESKSQPDVRISSQDDSCDVWYKVTKMRANHNVSVVVIRLLQAVMYGTKLQKWEQITTCSPFKVILQLLWCMVQSYKNESKSQLGRLYLIEWHSCDVWYKVTKMRANHNMSVVNAAAAGCDVWYKVTKMRANHNSSERVINSVLLWCMVQSYKNESKSQRFDVFLLCKSCCDVWYKVTKMRANHNCLLPKYFNVKLWCMVQSYKNESKSQQYALYKKDYFAVMYGTKLQKWEQITTCSLRPHTSIMLWCMVQSYKNESKSQLLRHPRHGLPAVMYGTKLQKWEQITTCF